MPPLMGFSASSVTYTSSEEEEVSCWTRGGGEERARTDLCSLSEVDERGEITGVLGDDDGHWRGKSAGSDEDALEARGSSLVS